MTTTGLETPRDGARPDGRELAHDDRIRDERIRRVTDRILIRDVSPVTPCAMSPKVVAGDEVWFSAMLVVDGHDVLAAELHSWPERHPENVRRHAMSVMEDGRAAVSFSFPSPGTYHFRVVARRDRFATWRRDLVVREAAGEDLTSEFVQGASLLEQLLDHRPPVTTPEMTSQMASAKTPQMASDAPALIPTAFVTTITTTISTLRSGTCSDRTKLRAALDHDVARWASSVMEPDGITSGATHPIRVDRELAVFGSWYEVFPRSEGGFDRGSELWHRLESIAEAGFDVLYLPPVHPIGVTHRKGRNNSLVASPDDVGSPWAIGSADGGHEALDTGLGTIPDFEAFVERARSLGVEIALDYALQCSPDHPWVTDHPEWFHQRADGTIRYAENPPKKYEDIYPINFWPHSDDDRVALWEACLGILLLWIDRGVTVFRVDNPHTKPLSFWQWIIAEVHADHPDIVFLSEAFTDPTMMHSLAEIGFTQSYTYFTWRHDKAGLTDYGLELAHAPAAGWFRPNLWPTTPDILTGQLRNGEPVHFMVRALLAATLSPSWGMYSGYELCEGDPHPTKEEYDFSEKYELKHRDYRDPHSIWSFISDLNHIRRSNPAFVRMNTLAFHHVDNEDVIAYSHVRRVEDGWNRVLVVANLRPEETREATLYLDRDAIRLADGGPVVVRDQMTGESWNWSGYGDYVRLDPADRIGHVFTIDYGTA